MYPMNKAINGRTFTRTQRLCVMNWSALNNMSDDEVYTELTKITALNTREDIDALADFASLHVPSRTFEFYTQHDRIRALLGGFQMGYVLAR